MDNTRERYEGEAELRYLRERLGHKRRRLEEARERDAVLAMKRKDFGRIGRSGVMTRQLSVAAVMNAVDSEGREVLTKDADGYWKDQDRREFGILEGPVSVKAMRNRLGKVSWRKVYN